MNQYEKVRQRLKCEGFIQSLLPQVKRKRETFPFTKYYGSKITLTCKLVSQAHPKGYTLHEAFLIPSVKQISLLYGRTCTRTLCWGKVVLSRVFIPYSACTPGTVTDVCLTYPSYWAYFIMCLNPSTFVGL